MAQKIEGWKMVVYYGNAGSQAGTLINANISDVDPGSGDIDFVDLPTRGDGTTIPRTDELPVQLKAAPKFTMIYHDTDAHVAALLGYAKAQTLKAFLFRRKLSGEIEFDGDGYLSVTAMTGQIKEGQPIEFTVHPNCALRNWLRS